MKTIKIFSYAVAVVLTSGLIYPFSEAIARGGESPGYTTSFEVKRAYRAAQQNASRTSHQIQRSLDNINNAKNHLEQMQAIGNPTQVHAAENELMSEEVMFSQALSQMSGVSRGEIEAMHSAGLSWGQVSNELGIMASASETSTMGIGGVSSSPAGHNNSQGLGIGAGTSSGAKGTQQGTNQSQASQEHQSSVATSQTNQDMSVGQNVDDTMSP